MRREPEIRHRRSIRLKGFDYSSPGAYFITIVTQDRACLFGEARHGEMQLNPAGKEIQKWWLELPRKFTFSSVGLYVIMPNHVHGVIVIEAGDDSESPGQTHRSAPTSSVATVGADLRVRPHAAVSQMIQWFKTMTTDAYIHGVKRLTWTPFNGRLWQRNYYEHVVRDTSDYERIYKYIDANPANWESDEEYPERA